MEPLQVESHDQAKTECSWIRGETEASADATVMTIILLKFSLDLFNYWKKKVMFENGCRVLTIRHQNVHFWKSADDTVIFINARYSHKSIKSAFAFRKVLETFLRGLGPHWHDSIARLLQICQLFKHIPEVLSWNKIWESGDHSHQLVWHQQPFTATLITFLSLCDAQFDLQQLILSVAKCVDCI